MNNFDNRGRKLCCKVSLYKNSQRQSCIAINCLSTGINTLAGGRRLPSEILAPMAYPVLKAASFDSFCLAAPQP